MMALAERGIDPKVVDDQIGRLTFAEDLARGIRHLLDRGAPYGTYNLTGSGDPTSWADVARQVYDLAGHDPQRVHGVSTAEYYATSAAAPRPVNSVLDLAKIRNTSFIPTDSVEGLRRFVAAIR